MVHAQWSAAELVLVKLFAHPILDQVDGAGAVAVGQRAQLVGAVGGQQHVEQFTLGFRTGDGGLRQSLGRAGLGTIAWRHEEEP